EFPRLLCRVASRGTPQLDLSFLHVRRVLASVATLNRVFAGLGKHLEFMGSASTDGTRVRFHGTKLKTATGEDPLVGLEHVFVFPLAVLHIRVKAIGIF